MERDRYHPERLDIGLHSLETRDTSGRGTASFCVPGPHGPPMNLLDTLALFGAAALAAPIGLLGVEFVVGGRTLVGVAFLAIAAGMVLVEKYVLTPRDVPGMVAQRLVSRVAKAPESDGDSDSDREA